ncbi:Histone deacetylase 4 [Seminavis robusta]|uniref:Histone deacetylase 4 n=1 Tax=Seminavis robusta TaxID=568900 RepID=A0A9N8E4P0_9STRA|nr:Histone deacetylase 4 [Seminavis robusta]|eukprot:Sro647_g180960.1 Histone deacetylase 4 (417) ;mRNA; f:42732-44055
MISICFRIAVIVAAYGTPLLSDALLDVPAPSNLPILFDSSNHLHRSLAYHPEQPARVEACVKALQEYQQESSCSRRLTLIDVSADTPGYEESDSEDSIRRQTISDAELEQARNVLLQIHDPSVVTNVEKRCQQSKQHRIDEGQDPLGFIGYVDDDTYLTTMSYDVCLRATATWMRAITWLYQQQKQNRDGGTTETSIPASAKSNGSLRHPTAMALTRPPGHHATHGMSNGFCLFNFAAAAAYHYQQLSTTAKISILDWDVHYGQGVADIVSKYPDTIRYASIHQSPAFPYMGTKREIRGNTLTIPMAAETTWRCGYETYLEEALNFLFASDHQPDLVIVCAGYDALDSDELASVSLNAADYGRMTRSLMGKIKESSGKKSVAFLLGLEGGYQLRHMAGGGNLQQAVVETVKALLEQ